MSARRMTNADKRNTFTIELPVRMGWFTTFYYSDCTSDVGEVGEELGAISGGLGGVLGVSHKPSGRKCFIWPPDLWEALIPALEALSDGEYDEGWEAVPELTAEDREKAGRKRTKAKAVAEKRHENPPDYPDSEWGPYGNTEASELEGVTFTPETGVGFEYRDGREHWFAELEGPREVRLAVNSFVGISAGAIHYYAELWIENLTYGGWSTIGPKIPPTVSGLQIRIEKKVTRTMLADGADWKGYKVGDWTYRFETERGARLAALSFFRERFEGDWKLVDRTMEDAERPSDSAPGGSRSVIGSRDRRRM